MPVVSAGKVDLDYERSGSGPPLLLIMGMSGTQRHWGDPFLQRLRRDFDTITYDHRGVGDSTRLRGSFTLADLAGDAVALLDALEIQTAHVIGISMGGMVAQELALSQPRRLRTLTLGCTYCGGPGSALAGPHVLQRLGEAMQSGDRDLAVRTGWEVNVSGSFAADEAAWQRFLAIGRQHRVAVPVIMAQMQAIAGHETSARLAQVEAPTLVIHGTEDQLLPVANAELIASLIPHARLEILPGVGHLFFWEQPERSAELVLEHAAAAVG